MKSIWPPSAGCNRPRGKEPLLAGMAGFVRWLAPRMDELKATFPRLVRTLRDQTLADGHARSHPRAAEMLASLTAGVSIFLDFAVEARALSPGEAVATENRIEAALLSAFQGQAEFQRDSDEVDRFLSLLRACLSSGNGHVADHLNQGPPAIRPHSWGWRDQGDDALKPMGDVLGWLNAIEGAAWINPESAFAAVQRLAKVQGEPLLISAPSLWRRLHERGLLGVVEQDPSRAHPRPTIKRAVGGRKVRVLVIDEKAKNPDYQPRRWVVEVCHSWFNRFRKRLVRYEKTDRSYMALVMIAAAIIALRKLSGKMNIIYG